MSDFVRHRLAQISGHSGQLLLTQGLRGVEREALRITAGGSLAMGPHPCALGSALTNPHITTDYSESLLEFITPPEPDVSTVFARLDAIHRFVHSQLGDELLWSASMPCRLPLEDQIPIAWYGNSHIGTFKHVYRQGLALRYGRTMQCIAGIHYNFSLSNGLWKLLHDDECADQSTVQHQSEGYIALIRNFHRYSWLLAYLFGASPALSTNFLRGKAHRLQALSKDTLHLPYATSLRMSDLGYQSNAQSRLLQPFNTLHEYVANLLNAVSTPYAPYEKLGTKHEGKWIQISANVLQTENELYSTIRPKPLIRPGERVIEALQSSGVNYVEVRCIDIDPFEPLGINLQTARFLDAFLLFCALDRSPPTNEAESKEIVDNFSRVAKEGRRPGLVLYRAGAEIPLQRWGLELLENIQEVAAVLDAEIAQPEHANSLSFQTKKLHDPQCTPSGQVQIAILAQGGSFQEFALQQSKLHADFFRAQPLCAKEKADFSSLAQSSLEMQSAIEREQSGDFDQYVSSFQKRVQQKHPFELSEHP